MTNANKKTVGFEGPASLAIIDAVGFQSQAKRLRVCPSVLCM